MYIQLSIVLLRNVAHRASSLAATSVEYEQAGLLQDRYTNMHKSVAGVECSLDWSSPLRDTTGLQTSYDLSDDDLLTSSSQGKSDLPGATDAS